MNGFIDQTQVDFITNGQAESPVGDRLGQVRFDPGLMRPWRDGDGKVYLDVMNGKSEWNEKLKRDVPGRDVVPLATFVSNGLLPAVYNSTALPRQVWQRIDRAVIKASRDRLRAWADVAAAETYSGFDGMGITSLIRDTMTDPGQAQVDMDGIAETRGDTPLFTPDILPLPITHAGYYVSARMLAQSRNSGTPLDTTLAESCSRRCAETIEQMTIGTLDMSSIVLGSSTEFTNRGIYGFCTHPDRITKADLTAVAGDTVDGVKDDVLAMRALAYAQKFYGPFVLYHSTHYDSILDNDYWVYSTSGGAAPTRTLRQRLMEIEGITAVRRLDFLSSAQTLLLVQMSSETVRAVNGLDFTTVQWEERGGAQINVKVMAIHVPDLRSQYVGSSTSSRVCGVVHATTA